MILSKTESKLPVYFIAKKRLQAFPLPLRHSPDLYDVGSRDLPPWALVPPDALGECRLMTSEAS